MHVSLVSVPHPVRGLYGAVCVVPPPIGLFDNHETGHRFLAFIVLCRIAVVMHTVMPPHSQ